METESHAIKQTMGENEIREEIKKFLEVDEGQLTEMQDLWDTAKADLRRRFIVLQAYLKRIKTAQINNLTLHLQEFEEQQQRQPRVDGGREVTRIRAELNGIETKSTIVRINESRSWFFEKINKIDKSLGGLIRKKRERSQVNTVGDTVREERLQNIPPKYKGLWEIGTKNCAPKYFRT